MLLLEQNTTRKEQVDENTTELDTGKDESRKYKVKAIYNSMVYTKDLELGHLPELYHLVFWKNYLEEENTWEPYLAVQYL